jgi:nanoRNase/pAp phosphatase (c-di-AMP/oligoRNAs hydrolase)
MSSSPSLLEVPTVITTHQNADFDALAAVVGASLLYPEGRIVFAGSLNPNVREFVSLHGENLPIVKLRLIDQNRIRQLIIVDTADTDKIGDLGRLCGKPGLEVVIFDHHESENPERPPFVKGENWVLSHDGAQATSMLYLLRERGVEIPRLAATIFALGIHEDTGSLTYPRTTIRDAEMLAASMRLGASQALIERYLHSALTAEQRLALMEMVDLVRLERYLETCRNQMPKFYLFGFADGQGAAEVNLALSTERAKAVAQLFRTSGIIPEVVRGVGGTNFVADNETEEGRHKNRRVEVWLK